MISNLFAKPSVRLAVQASAALLVIELAARFSGLERIYWAELSAVLVVCQTCGESLRKSLKRALATFLGAALGALLCHVLDAHGFDRHLYAFLVVPSAFLALYFFPKHYASYVFWMCFGLIVLLDFTTGKGQAIAWVRIYETSLGCFVGIASSLLILPQRSRESASAETVALLKELRSLLAVSVDAALGAPPPEGGLGKRLAGLRSRAAKLGDLKAAVESEELLFKSPDGSMAARLVALKALALQASDFLEHASLTKPQFDGPPLFGGWIRAVGDAVISDFDSVIASLEANAPPRPIAPSEELRASARASFMKLLAERPELKPAAGPQLLTVHWLWVLRFSLGKFVSSLSKA